MSLSTIEEDTRDWSEYSQDGYKKAMDLGNRGPLELDDSGKLIPSIIEAYQRTGFYVFTGVLDNGEVLELQRDFQDLLDNAPMAQEGKIDRKGRPVKFPGYYSLSYSSSDLFDAKDAGKNSVKGEATVGLVSHPLMMMDSALRVYGHPSILSIASSVNGPDFVPFHEGIFYKQPSVGPATPWHQDGRTHWDENGYSLEQNDGSGKTHGFNLSVSWSRGTPENCLWVLPGSHRRWLLHQGGKFPTVSARLKSAVPMMLAPGDCGMVNRSSLHGSFPNLSDEKRITMVLGFHKRDSAVGATTTNVHAFRIPGKTKKITYSEEYVLERSRMIPLAIDARKQRYPKEASFEYQGSYIGNAIWDEKTRAEISQENDEYWQQDITL